MIAIPTDQACRLRALVHGASRITRLRDGSARVIAVASGKGGVGKTSIAVNLAIALADRGRKVILVDADLGAANVDVLLNVQARWDLTHVIRRQRRVDEIVMSVEPTLGVLCGASGLPDSAELGPSDRSRFLEELSTLESLCDVMVIDCAAGVSHGVTAFARAADEILLVTTPEPTAMTNAYALMKALVRAGSPPPLSLVVNFAASIGEGRAIARRLASTARQFLGVSLDDAGQILRDENVARAVCQRTPFVRRYPNSPASTCLAALAERMSEARLPAFARPGFFQRAISFFY